MTTLLTHPTLYLHRLLEVPQTENEGPLICLCRTVVFSDECCHTTLRVKVSGLNELLRSSGSVRASLLQRAQQDLRQEQRSM